MDASISQTARASAEASSGQRGLLAKISAAFSAAVGAVAGIAPHVLHHVGPIAGASPLTGACGKMLF